MHTRHKARRDRTIFLFVVFSRLLIMSTMGLSLISSTAGVTGRVLSARTTSSAATAPSLTSASEGAWSIRAAACASGTTTGSSACSDGFFAALRFFFWDLEAGGGAPGTRRIVGVAGESDIFLGVVSVGEDGERP